jgi:hypothetical protein
VVENDVSFVDTDGIVHKNHAVLLASYGQNPSYVGKIDRQYEALTVPNVMFCGVQGTMIQQTDRLMDIVVKLLERIASNDYRIVKK